ncbi:06c7a47a-f969-407d-bc29-7acc76a83cd5 [Sclerotinia trifoliorum]|uniref:06c7a47a-f969-407d-bc29-7acc76a83cd5 n=1 Tax=Sclerotinia trifoliorum TaxID=28548 RepID=A0A8H2VWB5_9HELO|nr:06c7a47a-f969-407d-bc29-7acc76a83cd5 [Sclerotinia trifoliorum]
MIDLQLRHFRLFLLFSISFRNLLPWGYYLHKVHPSNLRWDTWELYIRVLKYVAFELPSFMRRDVLLRLGFHHIELEASGSFDIAAFSRL